MTSGSFYIAGIGASAGGHQALKDFFRNIPDETGISFCVVTHLLRDHRSVLDRILSAYTGMKVQRMKGSDLIQPNRVYVMPEGVKAYVRDQHIHLEPRHQHEIINKTVDEFFISLAEDQRDRAIGIIFSGMGEDGTRGVQAIHEKGGIVLIQDPNSTPFKSMPENAIRRDHPDQVLSPALLAKTILREITRKKLELNNS